MLVAYSTVCEGDPKLYEKYLDAKLEVCRYGLAVLSSNGFGGSRVVGGDTAVIAGLEFGGKAGLVLPGEAVAGFSANEIRELEGYGDGREDKIGGIDVGRGSSKGCVRGGDGGGIDGEVDVSSRDFGADGQGRAQFRGYGQLGSEVGEKSAAADGVVASGSGLSTKVGKWRRKNEKKKEKRREKEALLVDSGAVKEEVSWRVPRTRVVEKTEAQATLEAKWVVENRLKAFEAERKLELLKLQDVSAVAKLQERKLKAAGERAMVQIEKSHATLVATGNVPGVVPKGGYCTTVVGDPGLSDGSSPSCTISPDSSASMHEFRECQRKLADAEKRAEDAEKLLKRREIMDRATYAQSVAEFTAGSESVMSDGLKCELDRKFGESYEYEGKFGGKHVVRKVFYDGGMCVEDCEDFGDIY